MCSLWSVVTDLPITSHPISFFGCSLLLPWEIRGQIKRKIYKPFCYYSTQTSFACLIQCDSTHQPYSDVLCLCFPIQVVCLWLPPSAAEALEGTVQSRATRPWIHGANADCCLSCYVCIFKAQIDFLLCWLSSSSSPSHHRSAKHMTWLWGRPSHICSPLPHLFVVANLFSLRWSTYNQSIDRLHRQVISSLISCCKADYNSSMTVPRERNPGTIVTAAVEGVVVRRAQVKE